jgi:hypothetical protein
MRNRFWRICFLTALSVLTGLMHPSLHAQVLNGPPTLVSAPDAMEAMDSKEALRPVFDNSKPPPPTIADLVLLLQSYKPDPQRIAKLKAGMEEGPPTTTDQGQLAVAWHKKAMAAEELQEVEQRGEFLKKALHYARQSNAIEATAVGGLLRLRSEYSGNLSATNNLTDSIDSFVALASDIEKQGRNQGLLIPIYHHMISWVIWTMPG